MFETCLVFSKQLSKSAAGNTTPAADSDKFGMFLELMNKISGLPEEVGIIDKEDESCTEIQMNEQDSQLTLDPVEEGNSSRESMEESASEKSCEDRVCVHAVGLIIFISI